MVSELSQYNFPILSPNLPFYPCLNVINGCIEQLAPIENSLGRKNTVSSLRNLFWDSSLFLHSFRRKPGLSVVYFSGVSKEPYLPSAQEENLKIG